MVFHFSCLPVLVDGWKQGKPGVGPMHEICRSHASQKEVLQDTEGVFRQTVKHVRRIQEEQV